MNTKTVKKASEVVLRGVSVELETKDGTTMGVVVRDEFGGLLIVRNTGWSLDVLIPAPPKTVKRHRIQGVVKGLKFCEYFDDEFAASTRRMELDLTADECPIVVVELPEEE